LATTFLVAAGGCALVSPYRTPLKDSAGRAVTFNGKTEAELNLSDREVLYGARDQAEAMAESYRRAAIDHANAKTGLATSLVGVNTYALFAAATTNLPAHHKHLLPAVGFGSAGALNLGGLLISSPRQAVYLMGREVMLCAKTKTDPYVVARADESLLDSRPNAPATADPKNLARALLDLGRRLEQSRMEAAGLARVIGAVDNLTQAQIDLNAALAEAAGPEQRFHEAEFARAQSRRNLAAAQARKRRNSKAVAAAQKAADAADQAYIKARDSAEPAVLKVAELRRNIETYRAQISASGVSPSSSELGEARQDESRLQDLIKTASDQQVAANSMLDDLDAVAGRRHGAGLALYGDIERISAEIDSQVQRTEPDLDSIRKALTTSALASTRDFPTASTTVPAGGAAANAGLRSPARTSAPPLLRATSIDQLEAAIRDVADAELATKRVIDRIKSDEGKVSATSCSVEGLVGLRIVPPAGPLAAAGQLQLSIFTNGAPPTVQIDGDGKGLTTEVLSTDAAHGGFQARITATGDANAGKRTLVVRSADGVELKYAPFEVTTGAKTPPLAAAGAEPAWVATAPNAARILAFGLAQNSNDYDKALGAYAQAHAIHQAMDAADPTKVSSDILQAFGTVWEITDGQGIDPSTPASDFERWWLTKDRIKALQALLAPSGAKLTEHLDADTRKALKVQKSSDHLTAAIVQSLPFN
jgi:hypothetical protein